MPTRVLGSSGRVHGSPPQGPASATLRHRPRHGGARGDARCLHRADCEQGALATEPDQKVRICHATSSESNPYVSNEPAIGNNGDLNGGHLNDTGPVFPANDGGTSSRRTTYVDEDGKTQTFPGYNWTPEGQAIWQNGCNVPSPPTPPVPRARMRRADGRRVPRPLRLRQPELGPSHAAASELLLAGPEDRGQPTHVRPGPHPDVFRVESDRDRSWYLDAHRADRVKRSTRDAARARSRSSRSSSRSTDDGRFDLKIDGDVAGGAAAVGNGGTTRHDRRHGRHAHGERDGCRPDVARRLHDPDRLPDRRRSRDVVARGGRRRSSRCRFARGDVGRLRDHERGEAEAEDGRPACSNASSSDDDGPDVAVWGYENRHGRQVTIPIGPRNTFTPGDPENRGQPTPVRAGRQVGVLPDAVRRRGRQPRLAPRRRIQRQRSSTLDAPAPRRSSSARSSFRPTDPGIFDLKLNGTVVATGGNGTTTGRSSSASARER